MTPGRDPENGRDEHGRNSESERDEHGRNSESEREEDERDRVGTGTEWESTVGYSRAVRVGNEIHVSGTTATDETGAVVGVGNPGTQTEQALANVKAALAELGATLEDVVRTRLFVTDIDQWETIGRAHGEVFGNVRPATSMIQVERLIDPDMLVEIEAVAKVAKTST